MISESAAGPPRGKPNRQQAVLTVQDKTQVSKNLVRLCLGGSDYVKLNRNSCTDAYVKLLLPRPGSGLAAPFDMDRLRIEAPELLPARRTYTVRRWDDANERLWIDIVLHNAPGQHGLASDWATRAHEGDQIALMGAGGGYSPHPEADLHVLVGDHATVPAIAAALEVMPSSARGHAVIHVEDEADILPLSPGGLFARMGCWRARRASRGCRNARYSTRHHRQARCPCLLPRRTRPHEAVACPSRARKGHCAR